ncbi:MAG: ArgR family transcriptional regulator, partial [Enterococcus casseliflavus]
MKKKERQAIIKKLFVLHRIESQEELMNLLKKENVSAT